MNNLFLCWDDPRDITLLTTLLKNNNICIGSSDTVIGLLAPLTLEGYQKLNIIKNRSEKPYIVLAASLSQVSYFAKLPNTSYLYALIKMYWPGPLTVILQRNIDKLSFIQSENNTIAIRIPNHVGLLHLLGNIDGAFSTSANKAGFPVPKKIEDVDFDIQQLVTCTILDRHSKENSISSTIIDCSQEELILVREGIIPFSKLEQAAEMLKNKNV